MCCNSKAHEQIARSGGQVATCYDPKVVTHIIPGGSTITLKKTLRALGLQSLSEIPPDIHTVKWDWIVSGLSVSSSVTSCSFVVMLPLAQNGTPDSEVMHESYRQRIAHKYPKRQRCGDTNDKSKADSYSISNEISVIESVHLVHPCPTSS